MNRIVIPEEKFKARDQDVQIVLARQPSTLIRDPYFNNLQPQSIKSYFNNLSSIHIDSLTDNATGNPLNLSIQNSSLFSSNVNKLCVNSFFVTMQCIPNVNPRNQTVSFYSSVTASTYTVDVPTGFYNSPTALMDALVTALNTAAGSGLTFSHVIDPLLPTFSTLSAAGGNYYFTDSNMLKYGKHLIGLPVSTTPTANKVVGSIHLYYTRFIDVISNSLTKYSLNSNTSNKWGQNSLLYRAYIRTTIDGTNALIKTVTNRNWINWNLNETISTIQVSLRDEFGNPLYVYPDSLTNGSFTWGIELASATY